MDNQRLGSIVDTSTGYELVLLRVEREDYGIEYEVQLFRPNPPEGEDGHIEDLVTVPLKSDGTGFLPIRPIAS